MTLRELIWQEFRSEVSGNCQMFFVLTQSCHLVLIFTTLNPFSANRTVCLQF